MITDFRQVDEAFKAKLEGCILERDGIKFKVPVIYINPEKEFRKVKPNDIQGFHQISEDGELIQEQEDFYIYTTPTIAFYRAGIYPDNERWDNSTLRDSPRFSEDGSLIEVDMRRAPDPYLIYYGVIFYYEYQSEGVLINRHVINSLRRGAFLTINGDSYDVFFLTYRNPDATYKDFGDIKEKDAEGRIFSEQYLYKVEGELDLAERIPVKVSRILKVEEDIKDGYN